MELGWNGEDNLHVVANGKQIGGDRFYDYGKKLPFAVGRIWYEADINYKEGARNKHRIVYSNDGLVFVTYDLYETFFEIVGVVGNKKVNPQTGDSALYSTLQDAIDDYGGEASLLDVVKKAREMGGDSTGGIGTSGTGGSNGTRGAEDNPYSHYGITNADYKAYIDGKLDEYDLLSIARAVALFNSAEGAGEGVYYYKNAAHNLIVKIRKKYDQYYEKNDFYDYTHGGKYDPNKLLPIPAPPPFEMPVYLCTNIHKGIIDSSIGVEPQKGTDEWDTIQAALWIADFMINGGKYDKIESFKDQWVEGYREAIKKAAQKYDIPEVLLAGVIHIEVGGDPLWTDDVAYKLRELNIMGGDKDRTSFGNTSVQVLTAAKSLGYDVNRLSDNQREAIINSLKHPVQGIFVTAKHLSDLRDIDFNRKNASKLTDYEISVIASRYNRGTREILDELNLDYGNNVLSRKTKLRRLLGIE